MSDPTLDSDDLATYLGRGPLDDDRASMLIDLAWQLCESVVDPLPDGGTAVVLDVAARAYTNPQNVSAETVGPYSAQFAGGAGGLWLTRANKSTLRRLSGRGGAFTIETCPDTAGANVPWWDTTVRTPPDWDMPT